MPADDPAPVRSAHHRDFALPALVAAKGGRRVTVCLPARDEEATVGQIVAVIHQMVERSGLVDEVLVVDDGSLDATAEVAAAAGARVVASRGTGKGDALWTGLAEGRGDLVVFCDADVTTFGPHFVVGLLGPLLAFDGVGLVKGASDRDYDGRPGQGGRVTELTAKPLLRELFPELATVRQPLSGECAGPRAVLEQVPVVGGYGVDIGLLLDVAARFGPSAIAQVDLGPRAHRHRPLEQLSVQASEVVRTVLSRAGLGPPVAQRPPLACAPPWSA